MVALGSLVVVAFEQPSNLHALAFAALLWLLAGCATRLRYGVDLLVAGSRASAGAPASAPTADNSKQ